MKYDGWKTSFPFGEFAYFQGLCQMSGVYSNKKSKRLVDFHGFHVGKSTSPMDPMLNKSPLFQQKSSISKNASSNFRPKNTSKRPPAFCKASASRLGAFDLVSFDFGGKGGEIRKHPWLVFGGLSFFWGGLEKNGGKRGLIWFRKIFGILQRFFFCRWGRIWMGFCW